MATVERVFSAFVLVQPAFGNWPKSKITSKLVFLFKRLNKKEKYLVFSMVLVFKFIIIFSSEIHLKIFELGGEKKVILSIFNIFLPSNQ